MSNATKIIEYDEFLNNSRRPTFRPGHWKWSEMQPLLEASIQGDNTSGKGRGSVSFVHNDVPNAYAVCPSLNMLVQAFEPGVHGKPHRHSNFAIFIVKEGSGYSVIDGERIDWKAGDVFIAPPWARHEHCNPSTTQRAVLYTVQNVPEVSEKGIWFFQGSSGEGFEHLLPREGK